MSDITKHPLHYKRKPFDMVDDAKQVAQQYGEKVWITESSKMIVDPERPATADIAYEVFPGGRVIDWTRTP